VSGPPYPPPPAPGSNGIGLFEIGVSPIGTIDPFDVWSTIISQYANSPILTTLITNVAGYLSPTANIEQFFDLVFNVATAQGFGLDVWGRIVGVSRILKIVDGSNPQMGFNEAQPGSFGFGQGTFYGGQTITDNFALSDDAYRQLIFAKAAANITDGSIPAINRILMSLFPHRGNAWVTDGQQSVDAFGFQEAGNESGFNQSSFYSGTPLPTMVMTYTFAFQLTPVELAIVQQSGALPKPTGVKATVVQL
jgi:hypothetical protein